MNAGRTSKPQDQIVKISNKNDSKKCISEARAQHTDSVCFLDCSEDVHQIWVFDYKMDYENIEIIKD